MYVYVQAVLQVRKSAGPYSGQKHRGNSCMATENHRDHLNKTRTWGPPVPPPFSLTCHRQAQAICTLSHLISAIQSPQFVTNILTSSSLSMKHLLKDMKSRRDHLVPWIVIVQVYHPHILELASCPDILCNLELNFETDLCRSCSRTHMHIYIFPQDILTLDIKDVYYNLAVVRAPGSGSYAMWIESQVRFTIYLFVSGLSLGLSRLPSCWWRRFIQNRELNRNQKDQQLKMELAI